MATSELHARRARLVPAAAAPDEPVHYAAHSPSSRRDRPCWPVRSSRQPCRPALPQSQAARPGRAGVSAQVCSTSSALERADGALRQRRWRALQGVPKCGARLGPSPPSLAAPNDGRSLMVAAQPAPPPPAMLLPPSSPPPLPAACRRSPPACEPTNQGGLEQQRQEP